MPPGHCYRYLTANRNLGVVRDWSGDRYLYQGCPTIDTVVVQKPRFALVDDGLPAKPKLI